MSQTKGLFESPFESPFGSFARACLVPPAPPRRSWPCVVGDLTPCATAFARSTAAQPQGID